MMRRTWHETTSALGSVARASQRVRASLNTAAGDPMADDRPTPLSTEMSW
jgi:hypothetical protein